jgi:O-methyltransferase/methyltransferase family protein
MSSTPIPEHEDMSRLRQLIMGFRITQMIHVAAKLGLADQLARKPQSARELALVVGAEPVALHRLLRALASIGVFAESAGGVFAMTPMAEPLLRDRPGSLRSTAMLYGDELLWNAFGQLSRVVANGRSAFEQLHGRSFYEYLGEDPIAAKLFNDAMTGFSEQEAGAILEAYDFSAVRAIVDVGGGQGALVAALLRAHAPLHAVIFDRSPPTDDTRRLFERLDILGRAEFVQGDFFATVPAGGDLYVLKSIVHNWKDEDATAILRNCRLAMPPRGRLLVGERIIPPGNAAAEAKLFDINMMVTVGGQERTEAQYAALFAAAGLEMVRVIPTRSPISLIEAVPLPRRN